MTTLTIPFDKYEKTQKQKQQVLSMNILLQKKNTSLSKDITSSIQNDTFDNQDNLDNSEIW